MYRGDDQEFWMALVEWESGGLCEVTTENLHALRDMLNKEIEKRQDEEIAKD